MQKKTLRSGTWTPKDLDNQKVRAINHCTGPRRDRRWLRVEPPLGPKLNLRQLEPRVPTLGGEEPGRGRPREESQCRGRNPLGAWLEGAAVG